MGKKRHVYGGVYIASGGSGATNLLDLTTAADTTQDLVDQTIADTATLYIQLYPYNVKNFVLEQVSIGYIDTAQTNDLANVYLIEGPAANNALQCAKTRFQSGAVTEVTLDQTSNLGTPVRLDTAGKLYFITDWTTAVINAGAATEYFFIRVDGYIIEGT